MDEKLKSENTKKEQFSMFMLYFESNERLVPSGHSAPL